MSEASDPVAAPVVEAVRKAAPRPGSSLATRFAELVLGRLRSSELAVAVERADQLAKALVELFARVDGRKPGEVLVSLRDPGFVLLDGSRAEGSVLEVLSDDRPFIVTSVTEELFRLGYRVVRMQHPVLGSSRSESGRLTRLRRARHAPHRESIVQLELDSTIPPARAGYVTDCVERVLEDVLLATRDHEAMEAAMREAAACLRADGEAEAAALLEWLGADHWVALGCCSYLPEPSANLGDAAVVRLDQGLGLLAEPGGPLRQPVPDPLDAPVVLVARTTELSRVHRRVPIHRIDVAVSCDRDRRRVFRVVGVFTRAADSEPPRAIPLIRKKLEAILERHDVVPGSFDEQMLTSLFDVLPRDELFCTDVGALDSTITALVGDELSRRIRVIVRPDEVGRCVSVLLALPHEIYGRTLRQRVEAHLLAQLDGDEIDTELSLGNRSEALVRFLVRVRDGAPVPPGPFDDIAREVQLLCRTWEERLEVALAAGTDRKTASRLVRQWAPRFPAAYRDAVDPLVAATDIEALRELEQRGAGIEVRFVGGPGPDLHCRVYSTDRRVELSKFVPVFESLGLQAVDEVPWSLASGRHEVHEFTLRLAPSLPGGAAIDVRADGPRIAAAVLALLDGQAEVDSLNRLVIAAGLSVEQVNVLRAYRRYRRQVSARYSAEYVNDVLVRQPQIAAGLIAYFEAKFAGSPASAKADQIRAGLASACDGLTRLDDDRILRGLLGTVDATLRANLRVSPDGPLALKLDSAAVPDMPEPVPYREIFVYGQAVEGIHLRFGPVARGGIRWSERTDDYRNEVLDLARTQVLKNALIVPTGAKGGFVLRQAGRVDEAYKAFVGGLLDLTDDVRGDEVVPVPGRHDPDDPYLVVAADRGTATFSDLANQLAVERGFWLGDAFASGGSKGYDHKALGVTARGAWTAVPRHFEALGIDDMSGDVFGSGLLQSPTVKLVAAFDHRHVFCDPDPDPAVSFAERRRIHALPNSSWADYDRSLISEGGGVWARTMKRVELHPRLQELLRVTEPSLTPPELIQAILRAPVDLLFAGGIGTFVRASTEDDLAVDDRANSEVRVDASSLRARVVGEGANLAFTPKARIEYARRGGRINIDAIDNSAGVDTSDHEVNLKILLRLAEEAGEIDSAERDALLASATSDVVDAAVYAVARQCDAISMAQAESAEWFEAHVSLLDDLERSGVIDRDIEALPSDDELQARREADAGLTRPELAVLLAGAKRQLRAAILESPRLDEAASQGALSSYFPAAIAKRFARHLARHRLRRELVATVVTNDIVDRCGITAAHRLASETGADLADVAACAWVAMQVGGVATSLTAGAHGLELARAMADLYVQLARSYLSRGAYADPAGTVARDAPVAAELAVVASKPADLEAVPSVADLSARTGRSPAEIAQAFELVGSGLGLARFRERLRQTKAEGRWAQSFRAGLVADAAAVRDAVTLSALASAPGRDVRDALAAWMRSNTAVLGEIERVRREVDRDRASGLEGLAVLARAFRTLIR